MPSDLLVNIKEKITPDIQEVDQKFKLMQEQNKIIDIKQLRK